VRLQSLRRAMEAESSRIAEWRVEAHSELAAYMPYILLHQPADAAQPQQQGSLRSMLTARLRLAEEGNWTALIDAASRNEECCREALPLPKPCGRLAP